MYMMIEIDKKQKKSHRESCTCTYLCNIKLVFDVSGVMTLKA